MKKRFVSLILALAMVLCLFPAGPVQAAQEEAFDNSDLSFGLGNTAYCPACEKTVAWTAIGGDIKAAYWLSDGGHYYLSADITSFRRRDHCQYHRWQRGLPAPERSQHYVHCRLYPHLLQYYHLRCTEHYG